MLTRLLGRLQAAWMLAALLPLQTLAQPLSLAACRQLREQRDRLASEAMQAEISLVQATRRQLCPRQEALAEQAHAGGAAASVDAEPRSTAPGAGVAAGQRAGVADLDYDAYLLCRRQAEQRLQRSHVVLYINRRGFTFYTRRGAHFARQADGLQQGSQGSCEARSGG